MAKNFTITGDEITFAIAGKRYTQKISTKPINVTPPTLHPTLPTPPAFNPFSDRLFISLPSIRPQNPTKSLFSRIPSLESTLTTSETESASSSPTLPKVAEISLPGDSLKTSKEPEITKNTEIPRIYTTTTQLKIWKIPEISLSTTQPKPKVPLYSGNCTNSRSKPTAGLHAGRRDVVYKGLIRGIKTTLAQKFGKFTGKTKFSRQTKGCEVFKKEVKKFLEENLDKFGSFETVFGHTEEQKEYFTQVLAVFIEKGSHYPGKSKDVKDTAKALRKCVNGSSFWIKNYQKLFSSPCIQKFLSVLLKSGYIKDLISSRQNMKDLEERYLEAVNSIINFSENPVLMK